MLTLMMASLLAGCWLIHRNRKLVRLVKKRNARLQRQARQLARYNADLIQINAQLQQAIDEKSNVLGVAAHDLKNAVFGIQALSEVMLEENASTDDAERRLSLIRDSSRRALRCINGLLSSAASSVHGPLNTEIIAIGPVVERVACSFASQARPKGQRLTFEDSQEPACVDGDADRLREAVSNLVSNAVKYAPRGSTIEIRAATTPTDVRVAVSDEGPGLSPHEQEKLFEPFERLSPEPTGGEGSSGLGLYITKQIAQRHGGRVTVESAKGDGSTFAIVLPRITCEESGQRVTPDHVT